MPEHVIRLRGGWQIAPGSGAEPAAGAGRLSLPLDAPPAGDGPLRLLRAFQRPPVDPAAESVVLRLADVPGLRLATLNGERLDVPPGPVAVVAAPFEARNVLTLEVDRGALRQVGPDRRWGDVALVIVPRAEAGGTAPGPRLE